jgi:hypothetical protein
MSVAIATMGMFCNDLTGPVQGADDLGSDPYAFGGGAIPGSFAAKQKQKRLKVVVKKVNTFRKPTEIKVQIND